MADAGLFAYPAAMAESEDQVDTVQAAEQAYDAYGKLPLLTDVQGRIEADLLSGQSLSELPAWEATE